MENWSCQLINLTSISDAAAMLLLKNKDMNDEIKIEIMCWLDINTSL